MQLFCKVARAKRFNITFFITGSYMLSKQFINLLGGAAMYNPKVLFVPQVSQPLLTTVPTIVTRSVAPTSAAEERRASAPHASAAAEVRAAKVPPKIFANRAFKLGGVF